MSNPVLTAKTDLVLKGELALPSGNSPGPEVRVHDIAPVGRNGKYTMTELASDHTFFSAALLTATGLTVTPVSIYWAESGLSEKEAPVSIEFQQAVLQGLQDPWNRALYACPNEHAPGLLKFLDRFATMRPDGIWESVHQVVPVMDWTTLGRSTTVPLKPPTFNVHLYGVECWHALFHWIPPQNYWKEMVWLSFRKKQKIPTRRPFT